MKTSDEILREFFRELSRSVGNCEGLHVAECVPALNDELLTAGYHITPIEPTERFQEGFKAGECHATSFFINREPTEAQIEAASAKLVNFLCGTSYRKKLPMFSTWGIKPSHKSINDVTAEKVAKKILTAALTGNTRQADR